MSAKVVKKWVPKDKSVQEEKQEGGHSTENATIEVEVTKEGTSTKRHIGAPNMVVDPLSNEGPPVVVELYAAITRATV